MCRGRLWKVHQKISIEALQQRLRARHFVENIGRYLFNIPYNLMRIIVLAIRRLAKWFRRGQILVNSKWLRSPNADLNDPDWERRQVRVRFELFLKDFKREFKYSKFLKLQGLPHPLGPLELDLERKLQGPTDLADIERLSWIMDRVEDKGYVCGASLAVEPGAEDSGPITGIFDCDFSEGNDVYIFSPYSDVLQEQPGHCTQFRPHSWLVKVLAKQTLQC
jgi:hypothetical protein